MENIDVIKRELQHLILEYNPLLFDNWPFEDKPVNILAVITLDESVPKEYEENAPSRCFLL